VHSEPQGNHQEEIGAQNAFKNSLIRKKFISGYPKIATVSKTTTTFGL
jgi:hypothetical protein